MNSNNGLSSTLRTAVIVLALLSAIVGFLIGRSTATFSNAGPQHLSTGHLQQYLDGVASYYTFTGSDTFVKRSFCNSEDARAVLNTNENEVAMNPDFSGVIQTINIALEANGGCQAYLNQGQGATEPAEEGGFLGRALTWLLGLLLLAALFGGAYYLYKTQFAGGDDEDEFERSPRPRRIPPTSEPVERSAAPPPMREERPVERPVARRPRRSAPPPPSCRTTHHSQSVVSQPPTCAGMTVLISRSSLKTAAAISWESVGLASPSRLRSRMECGT